MNERIRRARERALTLLNTGGKKEMKSGEVTITVPSRGAVVIEQENEKG